MRFDETPQETRERLCRIQSMASEFPLLKRTLHIVRLGHRGAVYNNRPYWHHPVRVMLRIWHPEMTSSEVYVPLLHDTVEDNSEILRIEDLEDFGYHNSTLNSLELVTHDEEETYREYIKKIVDSENIPAIRTKIGDLYENMNNVRFLPEHKRGRIERYGKAIQELQPALAGAYEAVGRRPVPIISGELNASEVEHWIGEHPRFL